MAGEKRLTARKVAAHRADSILSDGAGLYLRGRTDRRSGTFGATWFFKASIGGGKRPEVGLGTREAVTLAQAREKAAACRAAIAAGRHPATALRQADDRPTWAEAARTFLDEVKLPALSSAKSRAKWERAFFKHGANLRALRVDHVDQDDIMTALRPIWTEKNVTARFNRAAYGALLGYCKVRGWREGDNPAAWAHNLEFLLTKAKPDVRHHAAMPYADVPAFYARLREDAKSMLGGGSARCLAFLILCAQRSGEVRGAEWGELDYDARVWTVPRLRTKKKLIDYRVPLTDQMLDVLGPHGGSGLVFPAPRRYDDRGLALPGQHVMSDNTLRKRMRDMGEGEATPHGFRSSFKDFCLERTDFAEAVTELCLGHVVGSEARNAYARTDQVEKRRAVKERWNAHVAGSA